MELHKRLFGKETLDPRSLIEISGPAHSGKTLLAQQLMAYYLCELDCDIFFVNLSHKVQVHNFAKIMESYGSISTEEDLEKRLQSVHLINCFTPKEFDDALQLMKCILFTNTRIRLVVVDTLSEFFWVETEHRTQRISKVKYYAKYLQCLETICKEANACIMWTVHNTFLAASGASSSKIQYKLQLSILPEGGNQLNGQRIELSSQGVRFLDTERSEASESR